MIDDKTKRAVTLIQEGLESVDMGSVKAFKVVDAERARVALQDMEKAGLIRNWSAYDMLQVQYGSIEKPFDPMKESDSVLADFLRHELYSYTFREIQEYPPTEKKWEDMFREERIQYLRSVWQKWRKDGKI